MMNSTNHVHDKNAADAGLLTLVTLLRFLGISADPEQIRHRSRTVDGKRIMASGTVNVSEAQAALTATGVTVSGTEGTAISGGTVAPFTDATLNATTSDFTATINWGDGTTTAGTAVQHAEFSYRCVGAGAQRTRAHCHEGRATMSFQGKENKVMHSLLKQVLLATLFSLSSVGTVLAQHAYITNQNSNNVSVIDTATNTVIATINVGAAPYGVAVSPDGSKVFVANAHSNTVSVIDTGSNTVTGTANVGSNPAGVAITPDGKKVYVANDASANVSVINTATPNAVSSTVTLGTPGNPNPVGVAVSPDGSVAFVGGGTPAQDSFVYVIATATDTLTTKIDIGFNSGPYGIAFTPDGTKAYVGRQGFGDVAVINPATNAVTGSVATGSGATAVAVSPDGTKLFVANGGDNTVSVVDTATNKVTGTFPTAGPFGLSVSDDGKLYVANPHSNTVSVINTCSNKVVATIPVGTLPFAFGTFIQSSETLGGCLRRGH